jgi:hypothetical protein
MNFEQRINDKPHFSVLFFAGLAAILFHPFFLGKFVVGGTDVLFNHYPNLLFGYREFWEFGKFSLWNRYIFAGADFTGSMHAHYLNPLYWPLLLVPQEYIFHVLTAGFIGMNALIGWLWFLISARLGVRGAGALLVGVVAQAGMFSWFAMTTMISVPMYLFSTAAIYLILTRVSRGDLTNYLGLSVALGLLFVTPHPTYILGFFLPVLVVFLAMVYPDWIRKPWRGFTPVFVAACVTGILFAAYRLVPVALAIMRDGNFLGHTGIAGALNYAYYGLTAFNPIALGIHLGDSMNIAEKLGFGSKRHTQIHNALYFGVVPLILVYIAVRVRGDIQTALLAGTYLILQLAYLYAFQPISDIVNLILYPLGHEGLLRTATNFAFLFLFIHCLKIITFGDRILLQKAIRESILISGFVLIAALAMNGKVLYKLPEIVEKIGPGVFLNGYRFILIGFVVGIALVCRLPASVLARTRLGMLGVFFGAFLFFIAFVAIYKRLPEVERVMAAFKNCLIVILVCFSVLLMARTEALKLTGKVTLICIMATIVFILLPTPTSPDGKDSSTYLAAIAGWGVFIALLSITLHLLGKRVSGYIESASMFRLLLVLTVVDLAMAFSSYSYVNVNSSPFVRHFKDIYPTWNLASFVDDYNSRPKEPASGNLLVNPEFSLVSDRLVGWALGGKNMTMCTSSSKIPLTRREGVTCVCYPEDDKGGNLYQDVALHGPVSEVAVGAWVRAEQGMEIGLFISAPFNNAGTAINKIKGDGKWRWIENQLITSGPLKTVRPHVNMAKAGCIEIYAPKLVQGMTIQPDSIPIDGYEIVRPERFFPQRVDLDSYRVNQVHIINKLAQSELLSNFAVTARTSTYAGVDSDISRDYVNFLSAFRALDPSWYHRAGILSSMDNERFLDLMGVGYDVAPSGVVVFRSNAVPRIAAFHQFEVQSDSDKLLQRLKAPDFDPVMRVLLEKAPTLPPGSSDKPGRFQQLSYRMTDADRLVVNITADSSRLIVFNDRYSPHWKALWNGESLPIIRSNALFMAVAVPDGAGELTFTFRPRLFQLLSMGSAVIALLLILLAGFVLVSPRFKGNQKASEKI